MPLPPSSTDRNADWRRTVTVSDAVLNELIAPEQAVCSPPNYEGSVDIFGRRPIVYVDPTHQTFSPLEATTAATINRGAILLAIHDVPGTPALFHSVDAISDPNLSIVQYDFRVPQCRFPVIPLRDPLDGIYPSVWDKIHDRDLAAQVGSLQQPRYFDLGGLLNIKWTKSLVTGNLCHGGRGRRAVGVVQEYLDECQVSGHRAGYARDFCEAMRTRIAGFGTSFRDARIAKYRCPLPPLFAVDVLYTPPEDGLSFPLVPWLLEIQAHFAFSGLEDADPSSYQQVHSTLQALKGGSRR
jgi:hypothetical protein